MLPVAVHQVAARIGVFITISLAILVSVGATPAWAQDYAAIIAQTDRTEADRVTDKRRDPVNLLTFTGPKLGWTVLDMGAGAGYSTELMARSVGPTGKVYGQVDEETAKLRSRTTTPAMSNVVVPALQRTIQSRGTCTISTSSPSTLRIMTQHTWGSIVPG